MIMIGAYILAGLLSLSIGSFLGAFTYRYEKGESITKGRSKCPNCKRTIRAIDNIPVISYLLLGGKCRDCGKNISPRYIAIELSTAMLLFVLGFFVKNCSGTSPLCTLAGQGFIGYLSIGILAFICISIFVVDFEQMVIPDVFTFFGIFVFTFPLLFSHELFFLRLAGGFIASLFLLLLHLGTGGKGMGLGDVKFAILGGLVLGIKLVVQWFFIAFLLGGVVGVLLLLTKKSKIGKQIPFGPFLVVALFVTFILGDLSRLLF